MSIKYKSKYSAALSLREGEIMRGYINSLDSIQPAFFDIQLKGIVYQ